MSTTYPRDARGLLQVPPKPHNLLNFSLSGNMISGIQTGMRPWNRGAEEGKFFGGVCSHICTYVPPPHILSPWFLFPDIHFLAHVPSELERYLHGKQLFIWDPARLGALGLCPKCMEALGAEGAAASSNMVSGAGISLCRFDWLPSESNTCWDTDNSVLCVIVMPHPPNSYAQHLQKPHHAPRTLPFVGHHQGLRVQEEAK